MTYMIVLKIGLSSLSFAYYLKKHCNTNSIGIAFFAIFYGLSGYLAAYSWNIMWLDCIILLPLIILGLEKLVKEDKGFLYCITLGLSILSNYYISIMICIFMVLYFIALIFIIPTGRTKAGYNKDGEYIEKYVHTNYIKKLFNFIIYSLLAGGLASVILVPEVLALQMTASSNSTFPQTVISYFSIIDMVARHLVDVKIHLGLDHWPNIYCGVAIFIFIPFYVMNKRVDYKEKIANFVLILFFFASFSINVLNFIWHGFHYPNSLPCRQSFIYIFLLLVMAFKGFQGLKERTIKQIVGVGAFAVGFVLLAEKVINEPDFFDYSVFYLSIIFIFIYAVLAYLYRKNKISIPILIVISLTVASMEAALNTSVTSVTTINRTVYKRVDEITSNLLQKANDVSDREFYRVERLNRRTKNDGAWYNFQSASVFSSTANANLTDFYKAVGLEGSTNAYSFSGGTPFIATIFDIKYYLNNEELPYDGLSTLVDYSSVDDEEGTSLEKVYLYNNKYTLPLGFMIPDDADTEWITQGYNPLEAQNNLAYVMANISDIFVRITNNMQNNICSIYPSEDSHIYVYITNTSIDNVTVTVNGKAETFSNVKRGFILDVGYCTPTDTITVATTDENQTLSCDTYALNQKSLEEFYNRMSQNPFEVTNYTTTSVEGTVNVKNDKLLFTTIPYEKGWTAYVDGEETDIEIFRDTFISLNLSAGQHTIEFKYTPDGLIIGVLISILSIAILILIYFVIKAIKLSRQEKENDILSKVTAQSEEKSVSANETKDSPNPDEHTDSLKDVTQQDKEVPVDTGEHIKDSKNDKNSDIDTNINISFASENSFIYTTDSVDDNIDDDYTDLSLEKLDHVFENIDSLDQK